MNARIAYMMALSLCILFAAVLIGYNSLYPETAMYSMGIWSAIVDIVVLLVVYGLTFWVIRWVLGRRQSDLSQHRPSVLLAQFGALLESLWFGFVIAFLLHLPKWSAVYRQQWRADIWSAGLVLSLASSIVRLIPARVPVEAPEPPPEAISPKRRAREVLSELMHETIYRGQVVHHQWLKPSAPTSTSSSADDEYLKVLRVILTEMGVKEFYTHQARALQLLGKHSSVVVSTSFGSGRTTLAFIETLRRVLYEAQHVLFILPTHEDSVLTAQRIDTLLGEARWQRQIANVLCLDAQGRNTVTQEMPEIVITTLEQLHEQILQHHAEHMEDFLSHLGLIVIENAEDIPTLDRAQAQPVIGRLLALCNYKGQQPDFLVTCSPTGNPLELATTITGVRQIEQVIDDGASLNGIELVLWVPPLDRVRPDDETVRRLNYRGEAVSVASAFVAAGLKTLVVSCSVPLTKDEESDLHDAVVTRVRAGAQDSSKLNNGLDVVSRLEMVSLHDMGSYDAAVITGFPDDYSNVAKSFQHLLKDGGVVVICVPEEPLSQHLVKNPGKLLAGPDHRSVAVQSKTHAMIHHLRYLLNELPSDRFVTEQQMKACLGPLCCRIRAKLDDWVKQNVVQVDVRHVEQAEIDIYRVIDYEAIADTLSYCLADTVGESVSVQDATTGEALFSIPAVYSDRDYLLGALIHWERERLVVESPLTQDRKLTVARKNRIFRFLGPEPQEEGRRDVFRTEWLCSVAVELPSGIPWRTQESSGGVPYHSVVLEELPVTETTNGYRAYSSDETIQDYEVSNFNQPMQREFISSCLILRLPDASPGAIRTIRNVLSALIPRRLLSTGHLLSVAVPQDSTDLLFYEIYPELFVVPPLADLLNISTLLNESLALLTSCPCASGCPCCCRVFSDTAGGQLDKLGAIRMLGKVVGKQAEAELTITCRQNGIPNDKQGQRRLNQIRDRCLDTLKQKFEIAIKDQAPMRVTSAEELGAGVLGLYRHSPQEILISEGLKEKQAIDVITHEYIHNWQYDPKADPPNFSPDLQGSGIPYDGKLFTEGFPEWVVYRMLDYFGLSEEMRIRDLREYDEYGEGFEVLKYIEDTEGFFAVIDFVQHGPGSHDLNQLYRESGMWDRIARKSAS